MYDTVQFILQGDEFEELAKAGFRFDLDDIVVRHGNPLDLLDWILPAPLR